MLCRAADSGISSSKILADKSNRLPLEVNPRGPTPATAFFVSALLLEVQNSRIRANFTENILRFM